MNRARRVALAALLSVAAGCGGGPSAPPPASPSPVDGPIVLVSIDTLRADRLPAYGYTKLKAPAIDGLASDGVLFERAYSHVPQTLPAHASILSGKLPFETGVRDNVGFGVKPGERMLAGLLHDRGYATAGIVSAYVLRADTGIGRGFDLFDADLPAASMETNIAQVRRDGAQSEAAAERWLDAQPSRRWFLFLHLYEPHKPYLSPPQFRALAPYDGAVAYADEIVGKLIDHLKARQLYDASTIVLLSDHGEGLGDHGEQEHGLFVYDESIHVPLVIKLPGRQGAGRRASDVVAHIDIVPTILDLVQAPARADLRGRSLAPLLRGAARLSERPVYSEALYARYHFGWSELTALTDDRFRYIKAPREELYDLQRDPHERDNLAAQRASARDALRSALDRFVAGQTIQPPGQIPTDARERLQALGYVGATTDVSRPGAELPDPKDKRAVLDAYRAAIDRAGDRQWAAGIALLQGILREDPAMADVWDQLAIFAMHVGRDDLALDAYKRYIALRPSEPSGYLGAAGLLLRMQRVQEAREHAELGARVATEADTRSRQSAHELLARIALAMHDSERARAEAALTRAADPRLPMPSYVEARLLYDEHKYAEALPLFERALNEQRQAGGAPLAELHYYAGDTYARLERYPQAEEQFGAELRDFPNNVRARAAAAMLYRASGRMELAGRTIDDMLRITPTPESYALAERLWNIFGNPQKAGAVRAEGQRAFGARQPR